jgi:hypothetical protein
MAGGCTDAGIHSTLNIRLRRFASLLLASLDEALIHIDTLNEAFRSEDAHRAFTSQEGLQRAWSNALVAIQVLEEVTGCTQIHARNALAHSHHRGHVPLGLAWSLISRLPNEHYIQRVEI